jgi:hypothetical protein
MLTASTIPMPPAPPPICRTANASASGDIDDPVCDTNRAATYRR